MSEVLSLTEHCGHFSQINPQHSTWERTWQYSDLDSNGAEETVLYIERGVLISGVEMYARVVYT